MFNFEDYIKEDDVSFFIESPYWEIQQHKNEIFNLSVLHNAEKCIEYFTQNIGLTLALLVNNPFLNLDSFKQFYRNIDIDDIEVSNRMAIAIESQREDIAIYLLDNTSYDFEHVIGFDYESTYKSGNIIPKSVADISLDCGNKTLMDKVLSLYQTKLYQISIQIGAVDNEYKQYKCDEDAQTLDELNFYKYHFEEGIKKLTDAKNNESLAA